MNEVEEEVHKVFKPKWVDDKEVRPYIKKDGTLSKRGLTNKEYDKLFSEILLQESKEVDEEGEIIIPKPPIDSI